MITLTVDPTKLRILETVVRTNLGPVIRGALHEIGIKVKDVMAKEPGPVKKPINWASEKQRRYVMAKVRQFGPWVRETHSLSEKLMGSWEVTDQSDLEVLVHNPVSYGPWVQGWFDQQLMHKQTGWKTDDQAVNEVSASGDVERILGASIDRVFEGRGA